MPEFVRKDDGFIVSSFARCITHIRHQGDICATSKLGVENRSEGSLRSRRGRGRLVYGTTVASEMRARVTFYANLLEFISRIYQENYLLGANEVLKYQAVGRQ